MFLRTWTGPCRPRFPVDKFQQKLWYLRKKKPNQTRRREKESVCFLKRYRAWETQLQPCQESRGPATALSAVPAAAGLVPHLPSQEKGTCRADPQCCLLWLWRSMEGLLPAASRSRSSATASQRACSHCCAPRSETSAGCLARCGCAGETGWEHRPTPFPAVGTGTGTGTGCCAPEGLQRLTALQSGEQETLRAVGSAGVLSYGHSVGRAGCPSAPARQKELSQSPCAQDLAIKQLCPPCARAAASEAALLSSLLRTRTKLPLPLLPSA